VSRQTSDSAIALDHLTREFGSRVAVADITLDARAGSLTGIVGPDGAGKTTLLRMLVGVLPPTRGDAWLDGVSVRHDPEGVKRRIGYMSQRFGLYADLTVAENIDFYADLYSVPRDERKHRLGELYEFSGLARFRDRHAGMLSGGMKQKLGLCCALIHQPSILVLDEPTFGVDPLSRHELWRFMHEMLAAGVTILLSTSYLDEAERCDRVALLNEGCLLAYDEPLTLQRSAALGGALLPTLEDVFIARLGAPRSDAALLETARV
jgi:ABC-2 type transport system ATP-binding protein